MRETQIASSWENITSTALEEKNPPYPNALHIRWLINRAESARRFCGAAFAA